MFSWHYAHIALQCTICGYMPCAINLAEVSDTVLCLVLSLPCPFKLEGAKLLSTSTSAVEWYKSHAHTSFLSEVIIIMCPT